MSNQRPKLEEKNKTVRKPLKKRKRKRKFAINWFIIIAVILIGLPFGALGWILFSASTETGTPQIGERFEGDLAYLIESEQVERLEIEIGGLTDAGKINISMNVATMRIYVEVNEGVNETAAKALQLAIYNKVNEVLPIERYFTNKDEVEQYDLEIYVFRDLEKDNIIYYRLVKNASAETYIVQNVGKPLDPDFAASLLAQIDDRGTSGTEDSSDTDDEEDVEED